MGPKKVIYEEREIEDTRLELIDDKEGLYYLGPHLILRRCHIILRVKTRCLLILPSQFMDCTIELKRGLKHLSWTCAVLKGCRFTGQLTGCDFGPWRSNQADWEYGSVENCDFSGTRMDGCRFHTCDTRTIQFPRWPCYTILDPIGRTQEFSRFPWSGNAEWHVQRYDKQPPSTVAVTYHAPTVARQYKTTEEEIKAAITQFDRVVY